MPLVSELFSWTARIASVATAAIVFAFARGEPSQWGKVTGAQVAGLILFGSGIVALLAAWRWPLAGAITALAALTLFTVLEYSLLHRFPGPWFAVLLGIPALLYLIGWWLGRASDLMS